MSGESVADDILRSGFERWQRLEGEKQAISDDLKELFAELKGQGFDGKALRAAFRTVAKIDDADVQEHNAVVDLYVNSLTAPRSGTVPATRIRAAREAIPEITEQQVAPQPASDLTTSPSLSGQVASHPVANVGEDADGAIAAASVDPASREVDDADRHQVAASGFSGEGGVGNPDPTTKYAAPGIVTTEHTPPEPVKWHPYAQCFPTVLGDDLKALERDIHTAFSGVKDPIVKIGNLILDGRARYGVARSLMIDYPVVQYDGSDPLIDVIAWNLASRFDRMTSGQIAATAKALCKLEPARADDIMQTFGLEIAEAAE